MKLRVLNGNFGIVKLPAGWEVPRWAKVQNDFLSLTYTQDELSIVCAESLIPSELNSEKHRRVLKVEGPLDFSLTGILSKLLHPIALAKISVFTLSTFDTDYILIHQAKLADVVRILRADGHEIS